MRYLQNEIIVADNRVFIAYSEIIQVKGDVNSPCYGSTCGFCPIEKICDYDTWFITSSFSKLETVRFCEL